MTQLHGSQTDDSNSFSSLIRFVPANLNAFVIVGLLDVFQILVLSLAPSTPIGNGSFVVVPQPSIGAFLHVFLGNAYVGTQEMIPVYSLYAFGRSMYALVPSMTLLGAAWHVSREGAVLRVFSFAYSWIEVSAYSYSFAQSFALFLRMVKRKPLSVRTVLRNWAIVVVALALAAVLEVMAMGVVA